jgi:membrane-associated phospholipid phosphatase
MRPARSPIFRGLLFLVLLLGPVLIAPAQLSVSLVADGLSVSGGALLAAASLGLHGSTEAMPIDIDKVNRFDRLAMFGYSRGFDVASDVLMYASVALPLIIALGTSPDQAFAAGVIYFEVMSRAFFAKNMLKFLVPRVRPWIYLAPTTGAAPEVFEGNDSFPSGHATLSFAAAAFGVTVAALELPSGSPWFVPFTVTEVSLAVITASFRVASGMHFLTDVIAGAALGTAIGIALPLMHTSFTGGSVGKSAAPLKFEVPILAFAL